MMEVMKCNIHTRSPKQKILLVLVRKYFHLWRVRFFERRSDLASSERARLTRSGFHVYRFSTSGQETTQDVTDATMARRALLGGDS